MRLMRESLTNVQWVICGRVSATGKAFSRLWSHGAFLLTDGAVTADGGALFFPDRVSNTALLLHVAGTTEAKITAASRVHSASVAVRAFDTSTITVTKDGYTTDTQKVAVKQNNGAHHVILKKAPKHR